MSETTRFDLVRQWQRQRDELEWWHSFELPDGNKIQGVNTLEGQKHRLGQFPIPQDLSGKRVLDIGAWDGWFSFEMERRGAEVVAVDVWDNPRFRLMSQWLQSKVEYRVMDVYDISPSTMGRFDIVLFLAVLYHLKHPLLALERVCSVTQNLAAVDSFILKDEHRPGADVADRPVMEFYESDEFGGQTDNWVGPSLQALLALCRTAGFARVELQTVLEHSAAVACHRTWDEHVDPGKPVPQLTAVSNNPGGGINFSSSRDEYVTVLFHYPENGLGRDDVQPQVGGFGTKPIFVGWHPDGIWQANFKLPLGLEAGWQPAEVRVRASAPSNPIPVALDVPVPDRQATITSVKDGTTWARDQIQLGAGRTLCLWVSGLPPNADQNTIHVLIDQAQVPVAYVEYPSESPEIARQVNVSIPEEISVGRANLRVVVGSRASEPAIVEIVP
jgi:tRNA (mo5U34)-methyltransferase